MQSPPIEARGAEPSIVGCTVASAVDLAPALVAATSFLQHHPDEVGYASPFALSAAFKRVRGVNPREHKRLAGVAG